MVQVGASGLHGHHLPPKAFSVHGVAPWAKAHHLGYTWPLAPTLAPPLGPTTPSTHVPIGAWGCLWLGACHGVAPNLVGHAFGANWGMPWHMQGQGVQPNKPSTQP